VPVTLGTTYWLVLKPAVTNESNSWNFAFPWVPGSLAGSYDDSTWSGGPTPQLPAFRLTATNATVTVQMMRGVSDSVFVNPSGGIDDPLEPIPDAGVLNNPTNQLPVSQGLVADGVTPLLFKFHETPTVQASYIVAIDNPTLAAHLHIWQNGTWGGNPVRFDGVTSTRFAYIDGLAPEAVIPTGQVEIVAALTLTNTQPPYEVVTQIFRVRRPPILLVHGYNSNSDTWGPDFLNALTAATASDFILPISYGVSNDFNTWGSFAALVPDLSAVLSAKEDLLHQGWAFTRYDVAAHSQGGVLTRLLCGQNESPYTLKFKGPRNFNR